MPVYPINNDGMCYITGCDIVLALALFCVVFDVTECYVITVK